MKKAAIIFSAAMLAAGTQSFAATPSEQETTVVTTTQPEIKAMPAAAEVSSKTRGFIAEASIGGMFEVESSKVAVNRAKDMDVKKFAQLMIDDHTKASSDLKDAVARAGLDTALLATALDAKHEKDLKELRDEKAEDFDEEYIDDQEDAHEKAVALFRAYAENGDVPALKDFAAKTLLTLEAHHKAAKEIDKRVD